MDDAIRNAFLKQCFEDRACGRDRDLDGYLALFPDHELLIRREHAALFADATDRDTVLAEGLPASIGPYVIRERIGAGGMGDVFLAEQTEPLRRLVAVKVIKLGMNTAEIISRFDTERQALALMDHPHIARVYDAGVSSEGRPYFAMEYVAGIPITELCNRENLDLDARLDLFLDVCDAVRHAHQRGVIHRDLKPSNVLVALDGNRRIAKVIDFGIAKATDERLTDQVLRTERGHILGTPEYMSPEQAGGDPFDIDTRTDVYSLGVLLYELLTGTTPFDRRAPHDYESVLRAIREDDPPPPSTRLAMSSVSAGREGTTLAMQRRVRGELDWITLKALEKDRDRRYASPAELAADVQRFRNREPVSAGPPGTAYRLRKFVQRHRTQVAGAGFALVVLIAGLVVSIVFWMQSVASEAQEKGAREFAELSFGKAQEAIDKMLSRVGEEDLRHVPQMEKLRRDLLEEALRLQREFLAAGDGHRRLRFATARAFRQCGSIHSLLGDDARAADDYARAEALLQALAQEQTPDADLAVRDERSLVHYRRGALLRKLGRFHEARNQYEASAALVDALLQEAPDRAEYALRRADLAMELGDVDAAVARVLALAERSPPVPAARDRAAVYLTNLGRQHLLQRRFAEATRAFEQARDWGLRVPAPRDQDARTRVANALLGLAESYRLADRLDDAEEAAGQADQWFRELVRDFPSTPWMRCSLTKACNTLALIAQARHDYSTQREHLVVAIEVSKVLADSYPWVPEYRKEHATALVNFATLVLNAPSLRSPGALEEARRHVVRAIELSSAGVSLALAALARLVEAELCELQGDPAAALESFRASAADYTKLLEARPDDPLLRLRARIASTKWARLLIDVGQARAARDQLVEAVRDLRSLDPPPGLARSAQRTLGTAENLLARAHSVLGEHDEAIATARRVCEQWPSDASGHLRAAEVYLAAARHAGATTEARKLAAAGRACAERACELHEDYSDADQAACHELLGRLLIELGQNQDAVAPLMAAIRCRRPALAGPSNTAAREAMRASFGHLAQVLVSLGDHVRLAAAARSLVRWLPSDHEAQFAAACAYAAAARIADHDAAKLESEQYAGTAVHCLAAAVDAGLKDSRRLDDPRLAVLGSLAGFLAVRRRLLERR